MRLRIGLGWWLILLALLWASYSHAVLPNEAAYTALKNDILASPDMATFVAGAEYQKIADAYNLPASPDFWVWSTSVSVKAIYDNVSVDGTTWNWTTYQQQSVQERDSWAQQVTGGYLNPSMPQVRDGFTKIFSGTGATVVAQRTHLLAMSRRRALRVEKITTTAGTGTTADPATMSYEGTITYKDVAHALTGAPLS